jgi:4-amino-4-deoxy-L-arabinose transferase-like glycosyltransferase
VNINPELTKTMDSERQKKGHLIDYNQIDQTQYDVPTQPFVTNDTIGYGLILGAMWKITGSFSFADVQWLQIILFSLLMLALYGIVLILFGSAQIAFWACIAQLFFFPILAMNVQPSRDIWAYYGVIILLYGVLRYLFDHLSLWLLIVCGAAFGVCQFVRPSVFLVLITISGVLFLYGLMHKAYLKKILLTIGILMSTNIFCFWAPFMAYNKIAYDRYLVGPVGLDLLEGLGEFPNRWGYKLDDIWAADYICNKYQVQGGTPEFDDKAKEEFVQAFHQEPSIYFINILKRLPGLILPGLPWIFYTQSPYGDGSLWQKVTAIMQSRTLFIDFMTRHVYIRLYLLLGYAGMVLLFIQRRYWIISVLLAGVLLGGLGKLPSHIEYRYVVPYYWVFALFAAYAMHSFGKKILCMK